MNDTSFETPYLKTLNISNNIYDRFVPDQVLTHHNLNKIIDYFEDQDRLSRVNTIGVGIGCGLDFFVETDENNNTVIKVNSGVGITTDGDLVIVNTSKSEQKAYEFRYYTNPFFNRADYARFNGLNISEIHTQEGAELLTGEQPLSSFSNLGSQYLLVYVENYNENPGICSGSGCDDTGEHIYANLKFLLTDKAGFDALTAEDMDSIYYYKKMRSFYDTLPELSVTRPILKSSNTKTHDAIYTLFKTSIESNNVVKKLQESFIKIIEKLDNRLNVKRFDITTQNVTDRFDKLITIGSFPALDIQYKFDFLKDLIETYNEIRCLLLHINADCVPNTTAFPKHLLLGAINEANREFTRHEFYPSHMVDQDDENLLHTLSLIIRFYNQLDQYQIPASGSLTVNGLPNSNAFKNVSIKITPSKDYAHLLSNRSIPYYYKTQSNLVKNWNFKDIVNRRATAQLGYHKSKLLNVDSIQNPLRHNHLGHLFYRIEGHLGKEYTSVLSKIEQLKRDNNLAFDIKAVSIGDALEKIDVDDYTCHFEDLKTILKAWEDEFKCLVKNGYEFFKKYSYKSVGENATSTNYIDYVRRADSKGNFAFRTKAAESAPQVEALISEATDYAIQETNSTDPEILYTVAYEYMVNEIGVFENEEEAFVYVQYPAQITTDLYAVEAEFVNDLQIYTQPDGLARFTKYLNKLCFDLNKAKEDIVTARTNQAFGDKKRDSMYEFMIYELSKLCCFKSKIEWLLKEIEIRKNRIFGKLTLCELVKSHPGIEHMAGVPKGGTFFIVYGGLDRQNNKFSNKVIADFAFPDMCCSDCPPNTIVIKQEVALLEDLTLEPNIFCISDGEIFPDGTFTPTPEDGTISSDQGEDFIENNVSFNPNVISDTLLGLPISFKVNDKPVAETATVYKIPNREHFNDPTNLEIIPTLNTDNETVNVTITPTTPYDNKGYLTYSWVNDIGVEIETSRILNVNLPIVDGRIFQNFSLVIGINNPEALCTTAIDILIDEEIIIEPEEVNLILDPSIFCFEDLSTVDVVGFDVTPTDGIVTSDQGTIYIEGGNKFNPNEVIDSLLGTVLRFKVNGQNVPQTATVYKLPEPKHFSDNANIVLQDNGINGDNESVNVSIIPSTPFDSNGYLTFQWSDENGNTVGEEQTLKIDIPIVDGTITQTFTLLIGVNNSLADCAIGYDITVDKRVIIEEDFSINPTTDRTCLIDGDEPGLIDLRPTPSDGVVTSPDDAEFMTNDNRLNPSKVPNGLLGKPISFQVNGKDVPGTITVYKIPNSENYKDPANLRADFDQLIDNGTKARFKINSSSPYDIVSYLKYTWKGSQGEQVKFNNNEFNVSFPVPADGKLNEDLELTISVNADGLPCSTSATLNIQRTFEVVIEERTCFTDYQTRLPNYPINEDLKRVQADTASTEFGSKLNSEIIQPTLSIFQTAIGFKEEDLNDKDKLKTTLDQIAGLMSFLSEVYIQSPDRREFLPQFIKIHEALAIMFLELTRCCEQADLGIFKEQIDTFQRIIGKDRKTFQENGIVYQLITQDFFDKYDAKGDDLRNILITVFNFS